jgi:hypothetical protein
MEIRNITEFLSQDRQYIIDDLDDLLSESVDIDWTTAVGATHIADYLLKLFNREIRQKGE